MTHLPRKLLYTLPLALACLVSQPGLAANWKLVSLDQVALLQYCDGSERIALTVSGDGLSMQNVYVVGPTATEEDRDLQVALTAIEFGLKAVIDLQPSTCPGTFFTPTVIVQNVPVARGTDRTAPAATSASPPPASPALTRPPLASPTANWKIASVAQLGMLMSCSGTQRPLLTLTGSELPASSLNVYFVGSDQTQDSRAFQIALVALRKGLAFVLDLQTSTCPGLYETSHVAVQNAPAP